MKKLTLLMCILLCGMIAQGQTLSLKGALLTAHKWKSAKTFNSGKEVTGKAEPIVYEFRADGTTTASSSTGSASGTWSFDKDETILVQDKVIRWEIIELTPESFKVKQGNKSFSLEIWYEPAK